MGRESQFTFFAVPVDVDSLAIANLALQDPLGQGGLDFLLQRALQRPGAIRRIIAGANQMFLGAIGQLQLNVPLLQPAAQASQLDVDDLL